MQSLTPAKPRDVHRSPSESSTKSSFNPPPHKPKKQANKLTGRTDAKRSPRVLPLCNTHQLQPKAIASAIRRVGRPMRQRSPTMPKPGDYARGHRIRHPVNRKDGCDSEVPGSRTGQHSPTPPKPIAPAAPRADCRLRQRSPRVPQTKAGQLQSPTPDLLIVLHRQTDRSSPHESTPSIPI